VAIEDLLVRVVEDGREDRFDVSASGRPAGSRVAGRDARRWDAGDLDDLDDLDEPGRGSRRGAARRDGRRADVSSGSVDTSSGRAPPPATRDVKIASRRGVAHVG
jgi:hypothetical protein